jgi:hypothetical protein
MKQQSNEVFGKNISELEEQIYSSGVTSVVATQTTSHLFSLCAIFIFLIMLAIICGLKYEVSSLKSTISQLNNENTSLKEQVAVQTKQALPDKNNTDDKTAEGFIYHIVQEGDCFENISKKYYQTGDYVSELARLNGLTAYSTLHIGQVIRVPKKIIN